MYIYYSQFFKLDTSWGDVIVFSSIKDLCNKNTLFFYILKYKLLKDKKLFW